jgi:hypothetical protein
MLWANHYQALLPAQIICNLRSNLAELCAVGGQTLLGMISPAESRKKIIHLFLINIWWNENSFISLYRTK